MSMVAILVMWPEPFMHFIRILHIRFDFDWPLCFRGMAAYLLNHHTVVTKEHACCECENVKESSGGSEGDSK